MLSHLEIQPYEASSRCRMENEVIGQEERIVQEERLSIVLEVILLLGAHAPPHAYGRECRQTSSQQLSVGDT